MASTSSLHGNAGIIGAPANKYSPVTKVGKDGAIEISNDFGDDDEDDDDGGDDDGWGDDWGEPKKEDLKNFDYENTNLNKLSAVQIAAHKKKMDEKFHKNQLKPGDSGFEYDKRIDFTKKANNKVDASWDEDVDNYFDDDFM